MIDHAEPLVVDAQHPGVAVALYFAHHHPIDLQQSHRREGIELSDKAATNRERNGGFRHQCLRGDAVGPSAANAADTRGEVLERSHRNYHVTALVFQAMHAKAIRKRPL